MPENIESERMLLVPCDLTLARAELAGAKALAAALGKRLGRVVAVPGDWPPPLNDRDSMKFFMDMLEAGGTAAVGWGLWIFLLKAEGKLVAAGNGGFKGPPDAGGIVELGYSICPPHQRLGLATAAAMSLVDWANRDGRVKGIIAHTLADLAPSIRVLRKCGFEGPYPFADPDPGPEGRIFRFVRVAKDPAIRAPTPRGHYESR